jgi:hypothetical protein
MNMMRLHLRCVLCFLLGYCAHIWIWGSFVSGASDVTVLN